MWIILVAPLKRTVDLVTHLYNKLVNKGNTAIVTKDAFVMFLKEHLMKVTEKTKDLL